MNFVLIFMNWSVIYHYSYSRVTVFTLCVTLFYERVEVLVTLTADVGRILARLHQVQPKGNISFLTAVRVAHVSASVILCQCQLADGQSLC